MAIDRDAVKRAIRAFILDEFLPNQAPEKLTGSTSLIGAGILDSISTLRLVGFLENVYDIEVEAHEVGVDNFDTIDRIGRYVCSKLETSSG